MKKSAHNLEARILARLHRGGRGSVLAARDLADLGSDAAVRQALSRATRAGRLRKVARGLYTIPRTDPDLGEVSPDVDAVVEALKSRDRLRLLPSGAHSANLLGLSTQVPVRLVFLTDGPTRRIRLGKRELVLKRTTPRQMATAGKISGTVIQALRWLGREHVDESVVRHLRKRLSASEKRALTRDVHHAPAWVAQILRQIASNTTRGA